MKPKTELKKQARQLRTKGVSINKIAKQLNVAKASVSVWVRDIILTEEQKKILSPPKEEKIKLPNKHLPFTDQQFIDIVKQSKILSDIYTKLNIKINGNNYNLINNKIKELNCDLKHFKNYDPTSGKLVNIIAKRALEYILIENSDYTSTNSLRKRLVNEGLLKYECYICNLTNWNNKPISLELDHINGIRSDNRLTNLRILCPNCHSLTPTYCSKNIQYQKENKIGTNGEI